MMYLPGSVKKDIKEISGDCKCKHYKKTAFLQRISATQYALQKNSATHNALQKMRCKKQGCRFSATQVNAALQKSATQCALQISKKSATQYVTCVADCQKISKLFSTTCLSL